MKRNYSNWIKAYVQHTRFSESPDSYHFWTGVATVAGALRRRVWIDENQFQWTPNFYIILVGPPGVAAKSTSIRQGLSILERVEGIYFGPQSMTWQALTEALQNAQEHVDVPGLPLPEIMSCLTISVSELGTFFNPDDRELVDVLVAMWDGQKEVWRRKTKSSGDTTIHNPWLNIIGCTTPAWLTQNFPESMIGGGLTSRMIFVYADRKRHLIAYPSQHILPADYKLEIELLAQDLQQVAGLSGEYILTPEALRWGEKWYSDLWKGDGRGLHLASERFDGYVSRKQAHIHKLAIVLAASKRNDLRIEAEDLVEAEAAVSSLEPDMLKVFESIGVSEASMKPTAIVALIRNHKGGIEYQSLWRACFTTMTGEEFTAGLKAAIDAGYVKAHKDGGKTFLHFTGPEREK